MSVRKATLNDLDELTMAGREYATNSTQLYEKFEQKINDTNQFEIYLVEKNEEVAGFAQIQFYQDKKRNLYNTDPTLPTGIYFNGLYIREKFRGQGLAKKLCQFRIERVKSMAEEIYVFLHHYKELYPFFLEFGFEFVGNFSVGESKGILLKLEKRAPKGP